MTAQTPSREREIDLLTRYPLVGGMDEVGRGALAGPVAVGLVVVGPTTSDNFPEGLADSKQLTARAREALEVPCQQWGVDWAIGMASATEIDERGIMGALRLAGRRALTEVASRGHAPGVIILDGSADWLTPPQADLFTAADPDPDPHLVPAPPVVMEVKADARCAVVSAASVIAKVQRDRDMSALEDPGYDWAKNKGYASPAHIAGLASLGAGEYHRRSWKLPGLDH